MNVDEARKIAIKAHEGQIDKAGEPYIGHIERVVAQVSSGKAQMVAWLHDVVEDTHYTLADLEKAGFPFDVLKAIDLLTKKSDLSLESYYAAIKNDPIAREVKLADLRDNMRLERLKNPTVKDVERVRKYKEYEKYLT